MSTTYKLTEDQIQAIRDACKVTLQHRFLANEDGKQSFVNDTKSFLAIVNVPVPFDFSIYNLPEFLDAIDLVGGINASITEVKGGLEIRNGNKVIYYQTASETAVPAFNSKIDVSKFEEDVAENPIEFSSTQLSEIRKASKILNVKYLRVIRTKGNKEVQLIVFDGTNDEKLSYKSVIELKEPSSVSDTFDLTIENLKIPSGSYDMAFNGKISYWESQDSGNVFLLASTTIPTS